MVGPAPHSRMQHYSVFRISKLQNHAIYRGNSGKLDKLGDISLQPYANRPTLTRCNFSNTQCPKLSFYFVHSQGAFPIKLCTRKLLHAPSQYIAIINGSNNVHTPGAHLLKSCTRPWKCARRVQGAPLISDTDTISFTKPKYEDNYMGFPVKRSLAF